MRELFHYTPDELYGFKDRLRELRQSIQGQRGPEAAHTRGYCTTMYKRINAELKRRNLPKCRPGDKRVYGPGQAKWQGANIEAA